MILNINRLFCKSHENRILILLLYTFIRMHTSYRFSWIIMVSQTTFQHRRHLVLIFWTNRSRFDNYGNAKLHKQLQIHYKIAKILNWFLTNTVFGQCFWQCFWHFCHCFYDNKFIVYFIIAAFWVNTTFEVYLSQLTTLRI